MKPQWTLAAIVVALAVGLVAGRVIAEEGEDEGMPMPKPGDEHAMMAKNAGEFDAHTKWWMAPDQPPMEGKDECTCKMVLGGWFMDMDYRGTWEGNPWKGRLLAGYDQVREEFVHVWVTDTGSDMAISRGTINDEGMLVLHGEMLDHMSGQPRMVETTFEWPDANTSVMTMYWCTGDNERENKMMEITFKRKAAKAPAAK